MCSAGFIILAILLRFPAWGIGNMVFGGDVLRAVAGWLLSFSFYIRVHVDRRHVVHTTVASSARGQLNNYLSNFLVVAMIQNIYDLHSSLSLYYVYE
jgi:hypothetical protein